MKKIVMRKRRNGIWHSMGQGNGSVQDQGGSGSGDGSGDSDDGDDLEDDDDDDDDDVGDPKSKSKGKSKEKVNDDPEKARLSQEAARRRRQAREERNRANTLQAQLDEIKNKDKPEVDRLKGENETFRTRAETAESDLNSSRLEAAFLRQAMKLGIDPTQLEFAEFKFSKTKIDVEEAGDDLNDEVAAVLKTVVAETPSLIPKKRGRKASDDDDDDDDDDENQSTTGRTAPAMNNGRRKPGKETPEQRKARLAKKFPALQGR